jgi:hypothetical protein
MCTDCLESFTASFAAPENAHVKIIGWSDEAMSDADMLARLPLIAATASQVDRYLRAWVGRIRERHLSYAEIGKALGVSRQAAWERFSRVVNGDAGSSGDSGDKDEDKDEDKDDDKGVTASV